MTWVSGGKVNCLSPDVTMQRESMPLASSADNAGDKSEHLSGPHTSDLLSRNLSLHDLLSICVLGSAGTYKGTFYTSSVILLEKCIAAINVQNHQRGVQYK